MGHQTTAMYGLNRGEVSELALGRVDIERLRLSAEVQENWLPRTLGPMMLRPGTAYIAETYNSSACVGVPFIFGASDTAILEFTDSLLRIFVNEAPIERVSVATTVPAFASWASSASTGATVTLGATLDISGNLAGLQSTATGTLTIAGGDQSKEHALRIVVERGPIKFRVGTASGLSDIFKTSTLDEGTHSLAFTPNTGTVYVQFESSEYALRRVSSVSMEAAGVLTLPSPYAAADLDDVRYETSGDTMFLTGGGAQQQRIERRGTRSYSIVLYKSPDGPFPAFPGDASVLMTPSAMIGNITITSNKAVFENDLVGALVRLFHNGQNTIRTLAAADTYSDVIRVSGVSSTTGGVAVNDRNFSVTIAGTFVGTLTLQRSFESATAGFTDYLTYVAPVGPTTISDNLSNIVAWYRIGFKAGSYTSGSATVTLAYIGGGGAGIARITGYTSATQVDAEVLKPFVATTAASDWRLQEWNDADGYPTAVALFEGRLWFAGQTKIWGSVSDAYTSFDLDKTGDAGPISRTIGHGAIQNIRWILPLARLMMGGDSSIITARSNSFDEPLTPTVFTLKDSLTVAASALRAVRVDSSGFFVSQSGRKAYETFFDIQKTDYSGKELTRLNPDIGVPGFVDIAVQREPDTRIYFVRTDGQVACLLYDKDDQVEAWWRIVTDGVIENVVVLPGTLESRVFFVVRRTIHGVTKRYWEKMARIDECQGGTLSKQMDCHAVYQGAATATLTGLDHLEGKEVVAWADGGEVGLTTNADPMRFTVAGGQITLPSAVANAVVGLPYSARFKSAKLAYAAQEGTAINQVKRVDHVGFQFTNTHSQGVKFGPDFDTLDDLPLIEDGGQVGYNVMNPTYDQQMIEFPGEYNTDSRVCLVAQAPRPCTVKGITIAIKTNG